MRDVRLFRRRCKLLLSPEIADEDLRLRVAQKIANLRRRVGGIQRQEDRACAQTGEIKQHRFGRFLHLHGDAVAGFDAKIAEHRGDAC